MAGSRARLQLSRSQILSFRRRVGSLDERLPAGATSLRKAAWAGLQDSTPRAALEAAFRSRPRHAAPARFLPSGDGYYLLWGADRELLVPEAKPRAALWTTRVWPGALLVNGAIVGVWRRSAAELSIEAWRRLTAAERVAIEAEAISLPLPALQRPVTIRWT